MSVLREIADALASSLGYESFTSVAESPRIDRLNWPTYDIEDLADPVISVTPATALVTRSSRTHKEYDYGVNVFIGRHTPTEAGADAMLDMAEELVDLLWKHDWDEAVTWPTGVTSPMTVEIDVNPDEALQDRNVWRAVITVVYRVHRTIE